MTIQETAAAARAEGLTYGQYVVRHRDDPAVTAVPQDPLVRRCAVCGERFWVSSTRSRKIYCSPLCGAAADYRRKRQEPKSRAGTCARCGTPYMAGKFAAKQKFCSARCRKADERARAKRKGGAG